MNPLTRQYFVLLVWTCRFRILCFSSMWSILLTCLLLFCDPLVHLFLVGFQICHILLHLHNVIRLGPKQENICYSHNVMTKTFNCCWSDPASCVWYKDLIITIMKMYCLLSLLVIFVILNVLLTWLCNQWVPFSCQVVSCWTFQPIAR